MNKVIVAEYVADWVEPYSGEVGGIPMVIASNHPKYTSGTRFDDGFLHVALAQGYTVVILPTGKPMTESEAEIFGEAEPISPKEKAIPPVVIDPLLADKGGRQKSGQF